MTLPVHRIEEDRFEGPERFTVELGESFAVVVVSDTAGVLHVHGYDLFYELEPGEPVPVELVADVPGVFEVELETTHTLLFEIEVSG